MCGVPVHAADDYLQKLIACGYRVAVCEQTEDPAEAKKRGSKSVVQRDVVRLVTPGTITEEKLLDPTRANYLMTLSRIKTSDGEDFALSWIDISTGIFRVTESRHEKLLADIMRVDPQEIIVADSFFMINPTSRFLMFSIALFHLNPLVSLIQSPLNVIFAIILNSQPLKVLPIIHAPNSPLLPLPFVISKKRKSRIALLLCALNAKMKALRFSLMQQPD